MTSQFQIDRAARIVLSGGVIAYPTEAVYGLGCLPDETDALARILAIKHRDAHKGLLLIAATLEQVEEQAILPSGSMRRRILDSWPGPVTWLLEARPTVPRMVTGGGSQLGIRITDHPVARRLCARAGVALVSTSANVSGRPPAVDALTLHRTLGASVDYVLPGALGDRARPSMIVDARNGAVIRAG